MGLQLRVRHALGARMLDIEPRGAQRPIVVGRTAEAEVQVPIGTVAPSHCVMYMEGERWVIQDMGSSVGTYVNGSPISGPVFLNFGDVVSLGAGSGSPTIEIDPMGSGRRKRAALGGPAGRPSQPTEQEPQAFYEDRVEMGPVSAAPVALGEGVQGGDWPVAVEEEAAEGDAWAGMGAATSGYRRRRRVKKQGSFVGITIGAGFAIILIGWFIVARVMKEDEPPAAAPSVAQDVRGGKGGKSIFDFPEKDKPKPTGQGEGTVLPPVAVAAADDPPKPAATDNDPERQTDEWKAVVEANAASEKAGKALWTIVDYRRLHPGKFEAELRQYEEVAFDRLWWERIKELCELRGSLQSEIEKKNTEIAQETEAAYRQKLEKEKQLLEMRRQTMGEVLVQEMGYASKEAPNLFDSVQMANLRRQRIAETYEVWKKRVINSLLKSRNLPWERTR
jgi:hypothetical protein